MHYRNVYRGGMGNVTSLERLAQDFDRLFTSRVFRLESLDWYDAPNERVPFAAFQAGERVDPAWREGWKQIARDIRASGRRMARVHVLSEPASEYMRFTLLHGYPANVEAGEDVRVLGRSAAQAAGLPRMDYWLFDDDLTAVLVYDGAGSVQHVEWHGRDDEQTLLDSCCEWRDTAMRLAVPLTEYVAEHNITERTRAA
jgi:hypothetical protein